MTRTSLRNGPTYPPEAEAPQDDGESEEDCQFAPLHGPIMTARLIGDHLVELGGEPGGAVPGIQRTIVAQGAHSAEERGRGDMAGAVGDLDRIDPRVRKTDPSGAL